MKPLLNLRPLSTSVFSTTLLSFSTSTTLSNPIKHTLTKQDLTKINLLIPRLCISSHLPEAINLITTSLTTTNPPLNSLSLSILTHSLTSQPQMTHCMSLLNKLKHSPNAESFVLPIITMLISSYFQKGKWKEGLKLYSWLVRKGIVCDEKVYCVLVNGFCRRGVVFEGLRVVREMVSRGFVVGEGLRMRVFRSLLREARVVEAKELNKFLESLVGDEDNERKKKVVVELLDQMINDWTE